MRGLHRRRQNENKTDKVEFLMKNENLTAQNKAAYTVTNIIYWMAFYSNPLQSLFPIACSFNLSA